MSKNSRYTEFERLVDRRDVSSLQGDVEAIEILEAATDVCAMRIGVERTRQLIGALAERLSTRQEGEFESR